MRNDTGKSKLAFTIALLAILLGIGLSLYSLVHHYKVKEHGKTDAFCNISETMSCDAVANSPYSEVLGIPLGGWGLGFFVACAFLLLSGFTSYRPLFLSLGIGRDAPPKVFRNGLLAVTEIGCIVSIILGAISYFAVGIWCPTCLAIYALCFILSGCVWVLHLSSRDRGFDILSAIKGGAYAAIPVLIIAAATFTIGKTRSADPTTADEHDRASESASNTVYTIPVATSPYQGFGEDFRKGSDDAKVTLVEFADFQCPACRDLGFTLNEIHSRFGDAVRIVFKNFPLSNECNPAMGGNNHKFACRIATLARCAGQYGKFWQYHDLAFAKQSELRNDSPEAWARSIGLNDTQIATCLKAQDIKEKLAADSRLGEKVDVDGTPSLYINGRKFRRPRSVEAISNEISKHL